MNRVFACLVIAAVLSSATLASAQPAPPEVDPLPPTRNTGGEAAAKDAPPESSPRAAEEGASIGYKAEAGVASTHMSQGVPKYATKSTPATEDFVGLRLKLGRFGTLMAGSGASIALASASSQPKSSTEFVPTVLHSVKIAPVSLAAGFRIKFQPRADVSDAAYEGLFKASLPNGYLTPVIELWPEVVRKRGLYAEMGVEHDFTIGHFSLVPRATFGVQGYDEKSEHLHPNELMATVPGKWSFGDGLYALIKPGYSYLIGPDKFVKDPSPGGRGAAFALLAFGAER
jgi:hypothetical protein